MENMPKLIALVMFAICFVSCAKTPSSQAVGNPTVGSIRASELAAKISADDAPIILDVRTQKEFDAGHIPGAINIPHTELESRIAELDNHKNDTIVVHCRSGKRAKTAEGILLQNGFKKVSDLEGHMLGWEKDGYPVE